MSTDRQKSFIGTLSCEGRPICIEWVFREGRGGYTLLVANADKDPARFYFRWERNAYILYVRDPSHIGQLVNLNGHGELAVSPPAEANSINFDLDGMTLDNFENNTVKLHLFVGNKHLITMKGTSNSPFPSGRDIPEKIYFESKSDQAFAYFTVNILERNAPYISHPDEV
ncbi:hypothetical protein [Pseudomonas atagonensis]|uniref:hypothetical protein n=1 Tax=Pseudomonas atagonensis TaxID=2609964 RepID=UPI00140C6B73|nr:hypothetical protein [Pseudomonas atagonensis]